MPNHEEAGAFAPSDRAPQAPQEIKTAPAGISGAAHPRSLRARSLARRSCLQRYCRACDSEGDSGRVAERVPLLYVPSPLFHFGGTSIVLRIICIMCTFSPPVFGIFSHHSRKNSATFRKNETLVPKCGIFCLSAPPEDTNSALIGGRILEQRRALCVFSCLPSPVGTSANARRQGKSMEESVKFS